METQPPLSKDIRLYHVAGTSLTLSIEHECRDRNFENNRHQYFGSPFTCQHSLLNRRCTCPSASLSCHHNPVIAGCRGRTPLLRLLFPSVYNKTNTGEKTLTDRTFQTQEERSSQRHFTPSEASRDDCHLVSHHVRCVGVRVFEL